MAVTLAAVALCSSSAETGGAMMFKYPGVNCISESVPADGIFWDSNPLNPAEYSGTAAENMPTILSPDLPPIDTEVEVFCPIPYIQKLETQKFGTADLAGSSDAELQYYEIQAFVDDNEPDSSTGPFPAMDKDVFCSVLATDAEVPEGENTFDWERSGVVGTGASARQTVLRWLMLYSSVDSSLFLTLHCTLPKISFKSKSQIVGYGLKKARLVP
jgi:hypothetical protein